MLGLLWDKDQQNISHLTLDFNYLPPLFDWQQASNKTRDFFVVVVVVLQHLKVRCVEFSGI